MLDTITNDYVMMLLNSCVRMKITEPVSFGSQWLNPHLRTQGESRLTGFFTPISRVCRTKVCQCSGLMTRNRARFMNHGAVDLCKVLQKTGKKLRLAFGLRYRHLIDELHSLADSSITWYGYKGSLTTRGLTMP